MSLDRAHTIKIALSVLLFALILAIFSSHRGQMNSAYLALAAACTLIVYAVVRRSSKELLGVVAGWIALAVLDARVLHSPLMFMIAFAFVSLATLAIMGWRLIWAQKEDRKLLLCCFIPSVPVVLLDWTGISLHHVTELLHPKTFDLFLYSFDCSLRFQPSFLMGQLLWTWPSLKFASLFIYNALPLALALVYGGHLRLGGGRPALAMLTFVVTGPVGYLFYNVMPACGPVHLFGDAFPWHPLSIAQAMQMRVEPIVVHSLRNAIPSLHMTWVLLVWWNSWRLPRWIRAIAMVFVVFTVMATLGTGEHYIIDLVVAFPFSLMVQALCSYQLPWREGERRTGFLFGVFVTLTWLALLSYATRLFWISPVIPWAMSVVTVASSIVLWQRLLWVGTEEQPERSRAMAAAGTA